MIRIRKKTERNKEILPSQIIDVPLNLPLDFHFIPENRRPAEVLSDEITFIFLDHCTDSDLVKIRVEYVFSMAWTLHELFMDKSRLKAVAEGDVFS